MLQIPNENLSEPPAKRGRGRPSGSKSTRKPASFLRPHVLEISDGGDIAEATAILARCLGGYVSILTANGPVSFAVLKHPSCSSTADLTDLTLRGCYEILSISAAFVGGDSSGGISVTMAGMNGEVVGGNLTGPLVAAGKVVVVVAELWNPMLGLFVAEGLDSGQEWWEMGIEAEQNEEDNFGAPAIEEKNGNFVPSDDDGDEWDSDEWYRNLFG
ncbi:AT-hook motif nuclear-localized protein 19-like [Dendrobium catenatum]|uniref:DNA-binding protein ESCAROLA n=1 Tax=Dendrobium catenatum TaxID=906689 RepID=A0A2I0XHY8_9ASPA|nr:AT-hook motif nuclear-localized protein 19-like [Dendrobium catenatum]PKU87510.1 Putative DNA-binding protein ESCAROLA [Dendrobium catenatum]